MKNVIFKSEPNECVYICNTCFKLRGDCNCEDNSYLGLDEHIVKTIQLLHSKGYQTIGCCEGHVQLYTTPSGCTYSSLSDTYISLDIHSYEEMKKEVKKSGNTEIKVKLFKGMENKRYQIILPGIKKKGDWYDVLIDYKKNRIKELEESIEKFKKRKITEKIIKTHY